jgi:hypothetical protein
MKNIKSLLIFIKTFFFSKDLYLINSPSQYLCLVEWISFSNIDQKNIKVIIGYTSDSSIKQIKDIHKKYYNITNIFFLGEIIKENYFKFILNFYKVFSVKKNCTVVGDYKYYLFKPIYKKSYKVIFLDEGLSLTRFDYDSIKNDNYKLFSIFKHLNDNLLIYNNYNFLKKEIKNLNVISNQIFLLGTAAADYELITEDFYYQKIVSFANLYKSFEIIFIPHRNESKYRKFKFPDNLITKNLNLPIEYAITQLSEIPYKIAGFYSMSLFNLSIILLDQKINLINISYDKKNYTNSEIRKSFEIVSNLQQFKNIKQLFI